MVNTRGIRNRALLIEVGGTQTRLALTCPSSERPVLEHVTVVLTPARSVDPCVRAFLELHRLTSPPRFCAAAVAGRVHRDGKGQVASLTNVNLVIRSRQLARSAGASETLLVNDLAAVAAALPLLGARDREPVGPPRRTRGGLRLVIGLGTGFGLAALTSDGEVIASEAGHADLPAVSRDEGHWREQLASTAGGSIETLLSGTGLARLHGVVTGLAASAPDAIVQEALRGEPQAIETLDAFCTWFGRIVGNLVLSYGAWGGVYFTGGVMRGLRPVFRVNAFRAGVQAKEHFARDLASVPLYWIKHPQPALLGLARLARLRT